ncbi:DNA-binding response regulator, NarL/FixJ family, contains REC and HTH domains [Nonomuraea maritima]|uniref:DNA-binding response regulator, NarL/FixJ family, contains REC and HTH domains n=1 Tax=Nonomuraea maritima TaxID=683260 RepID=A0A1G9P789_9ACTN|nr:response regulator transcription factor [Nonomuraea maritima]SDL94025.1 DNA-binding response regulator, NarL/FixJ family, contains REC and HTH domains [Nonomuraea maritima]
MIRVLLVDDQLLMREGLRKLLQIEPGIEVCGSAKDGVDALDLLARLAPGDRPHVALVDVQMPRMNGVELVTRLRAQHPDIAPLMLTTFDDDDFVFGGLRAGAQGYLLKDIAPEELVDAIERAARGETVLGGPAAERLVAALRGDMPAPEEPPVLSEREYEVARLVGAGASTREIARTLHITTGTAKNHISSCLRKLDLRDRAQLAVWAVRHT